MGEFQARASARDDAVVTGCVRLWGMLTILVALGIGNAAMAQEIRYSWVDLSFMGQDVGRAGSLTPLPGQTVDIAVTDGSGVRFRGSVGTWKNFYLMVDYGSTDVDLTGTVTNTNTGFEQGFADEFDVTSIRGGVGLKYSLFYSTDIYGELTYDSLDFDFGSFAGENFDTDFQDVGVTIGVRSMLSAEIELRAHARHTAVGDVDLNTGAMESDTLYGVGFGFELVRGLSITGDYESGIFSNWNIGFRLDLDED